MYIEAVYGYDSVTGVGKPSYQGLKGVFRGKGRSHDPKWPQIIITADGNIA